MNETKERKEITKEKFKLIVWGLIGIGLLINGIAYSFLQKDLSLTSIWFGVLVFGLILMGIGAGIGYSRTWRIKDYD